MIQDTDLMVVQRGANLYRVTVAEIKAGKLQSTDLLVLQTGAGLQRVTASQLQGGGIMIGKNWFVIQRNSTLYKVDWDDVTHLFP